MSDGHGLMLLAAFGERLIANVWERRTPTQGERCVPGRPCHLRGPDWQVVVEQARADLGRTLPCVQDIGVGAARLTAVSRPEQSPTVFLEFRGLRDAPHVADKDTRVRIALSMQRAVELRRELSELLPSQVEWRTQFGDILAGHMGETFEGEDAVEILKRLSAFWREHHPT
jgi:hypothetical protein